MSDEGLTQAPTVFSSKERAALVAKALSEAARRARFSTKRRRSLSASGFRARRGERLFKILRVLSFLGIVVVPSLAAAGYLFLIASDQYTAEARFTVRGGLPPSMDAIGTLTGAPPVLIIQDTQIIMNYLVSRGVVEALNKSVGLEHLYQDRDADWLSRLGPSPSIEKTVKYWKRHIDLSVQVPAGIVVMTVKAFSPDSAVKIADGALAASEALVNDINDKMRVDAVSLAETERQRAQENLAHARAALEKARDDEGILNADVAVGGGQRADDPGARDAAENAAGLRRPAPLRSRRRAAAAQPANQDRRRQDRGGQAPEPDDPGEAERGEGRGACPAPSRAWTTRPWRTSSPRRSTRGRWPRWSTRASRAKPS